MLLLNFSNKIMCVCIYVYMCICVYICIYNGWHGTQMSRFDTISVQQEKKKEMYNARFLFIYFEQTVVQITIFFFFPPRYTTYYYMFIYLKSVSFSQIKAGLYTVIINKTKCLKLILLV